MTPDADSHQPRCTLVAIAVMAGLAAATAITFWPALSGAFLNWDDTVNYVRNESFRGAEPAAWAWSWRANTLGVYQPVSWMIFGAINGDGLPSAARFHAAAIVVHAITAMLCALLFVRLLDVRWPRRSDEGGSGRWLAAGIGAAAYALHPLRAETVAWASALPYELAAMFSVASVVAYLGAVGGGERLRWRWYASSLALAAAAMFSKSAAVALPVVLVVLDAYPLRRFSGDLTRWGRIALEKLPFVLIAVVAITGAVWASSSTERSVEIGSSAGRGALATYGLAFAVTRTCFPVGLSGYYPRPIVVNPTEAGFLIAGAIVVIVTVTLVAMRRRIPALTAAWAVYLIILLPAVGLVSHGHQLTADRYTTLSTIGLFAILAAGLWRLRGATVRRLSMALGAAAVMGLAALSWQRAHHWHDSVSFWSRVVARRPNSYFAHKSLAGALTDAGQVSQAERELRTSLRLNPEFALTHYDLGVLLLDRGDVDGAIAAFQRTTELMPSFAAGYYNLGVALARAGRLEEAATALARARNEAPDDLPTLNNLGVVLVELGRGDEAVRVLSGAASRHPDNADVQFNLGNARSSAGDPNGAAAAFDRALKLDPTHADAAANAARLAVNRGDWPRALGILRAAHERSPENDGAALMLAWVLLNVPDAAIRDVQGSADLAATVARKDAESKAQALEILDAAIRAGAKPPFKQRP